MHIYFSFKKKLFSNNFLAHQIKNAIKRRAIDTDETAQKIISTAVTNYSETAAA
jgi:hypothetical protein